MRRVGFKINTLAAVSRRARAASTVRDAGVVVNGDGGGGGCGGGAAAATTMTTTRDGCRLVNFCPRSDRHACCERRRRRPPVLPSVNAYLSHK